MNIFIDTNILLNFYHLSGPDLDELLKVIKLAENKKLNVLVPMQVRDEFLRNRENVIRDALNQFAKTKAVSSVPNLVRTNPKWPELRKAIQGVNDLVKELQEETNTEIADNKLKADEVIRSLFTQCPPKSISSKVVERAKLRMALGNPPGKEESLGDAINWEWLLDTLPAKSDLTIISMDGDYESELKEGEPKQFLREEWAAVKGGELRLFKGLPQFFEKCFPDVKLSGEIDKAIEIERLENSYSFAGTHGAIATLSKYDDFNDAELLRIVGAYISNHQIHWILGDSDVLAFAEKIIGLIKSPKILEAAEPLLKMYAQVKASQADDEDTSF